MYPISSSTSVSLVTEASTLSTAADAFCTLAESEDWVVESEGLLKVAQALFDGEELEDDTKTYAAELDVANAPLEATLPLILEDIEGAGEALVELNKIALEFIYSDEGSEPTRKDVMRFERALVWSQKAERAFSNAIDIAAERGASVDQLRAELEAFAQHIDSTKTIADRLAARYAQVQDATA